MYSNSKNHNDPNAMILNIGIRADGSINVKYQLDDGVSGEGVFIAWVDFIMWLNKKAGIWDVQHLIEQLNQATHGVPKAELTPVLDAVGTNGNIIGP